MNRSLPLIAVALFSLALPATAQTPRPPPCADEVYRQFDFWVGDWEVRNADGELLGHNEIKPIGNGCGLLENWRGAGGGEGMSINAYDPVIGNWTQRWVGVGVMLWLHGGLDGDNMVLTSITKRDTPRGPALDRISWAPLDDGRVQQMWDMSNDDGETWTRVFDGFYARGAAADE